jgi:CelD/BcsL family acetyltransferase involved in cellulose biosynthesis
MFCSTHDPKRFVEEWMIYWHASAQTTVEHRANLPTEYSIGAVAMEEWEQLLDRFPQHTVFHTLPWLTSILEVHKPQLRLVRADADEECVAVWPVFATRKGPLHIVGSPLPGWSTAYLGPLFIENCDEHRAIDAMLNSDLVRRNSYFACKSINFGQRPVDLSPFGFENVLDFETYCLDLTVGHDALWQNLKSECRTQIRKGQKMGVEIAYETDDSFLDQYWEMSVETFANTHIQPMFTRPFLQEMWKRLSEVDRVRGISAWHKGERIASLILPLDNHTMYYWSGASYLRCRGIPANNLLHWEAIQEANRLGLQRYDFISTLGGAGRFKRTFGPELVHSATHWERTSSRLVKALRNGYEQYMMLRQRARG